MSPRRRAGRPGGVWHDLTRTEAPGIDPGGFFRLTGSVGGPSTKEDSMENDHRRLGRELGLFTTDSGVGTGLPLWLPDGAVIRAELERFAMHEALRGGCQRVYTPVLAKRELYERSGHWAKFSADMFPP